MRDGDLYTFVDGGTDVRGILLSSIKAIVENKGDVIARKLVLTLTEAPVRLRYPGQKMLSLTQGVYIVATKKTIKNLPRIEYKIVGGSTAGDVIGPFNLQKPDEQVRRTHEEKRQFLENRITAVGGAGDTDDEVDDGEAEPKEDDKVPHG